jgi:hypothetical protein
MHSHYCGPMQDPSPKEDKSRLVTPFTDGF